MCTGARRGVSVKALAILALFAALMVVSCGSDFSPKNAVVGVRVLAARADKPYAAPGESVRIESLVHDGRKAPASPMRLFWFPVPCIDPIGGQYYGCYPYFEALYPLGVDLTPSLVEANELTISIPQDTLANVVVRPGQRERFATAYVFMVACAGHVERLPRRGGLGPNALPLGCFDANGKELGADDFVLGFTRVFVFDTRKNALPNLDGVTFEGKPVDLSAGITTGKCVKDESTGECKKVKLDVVFSDAASEPDPENISVEGNVLRETIYVDWFTSTGKFGSDRKILFDGNLNKRPPKSAIEYEPPNDPATGTIWAVLHDNRGGTSWAVIPLTIQ